MKVIGIDLGTTNTVGAVDSRVLDLGDGEPLLASVVAYPPMGDRQIGNGARLRRGSDPLNTIHSAKRIIGQSWFSYRTRKFRKDYPFDVINHEGSPAFRTRSGVITPTEIGTAIIEELCSCARITPSQYDAVICVPSVFQGEQRAATEEACRDCGFEHIRVIDEPVATAHAYLKRADQEIKYAAVYDFGGGTFDLAVLDCSHGVPHVLAHGGDAYTGGDDIDRALAQYVAEQVLRQTGWDLQNDRSVFAQLVFECERAKLRLASHDRTVIDIVCGVDHAAPQAVKAVELERTELESRAGELVRGTFVICDQVLNEAALNVDDIEVVFLAGGTTCMDLVRRYVGKYFRSARVLGDIHPTHVVAVGASLIMT